MTNARLLGLARALVLPTIMLAGCNEAAPTASKPLTAVEVQPARVQIEPVSVTLTGSIAARIESDLGFRIAGRVATRTVDVGDHVKKGQILATLETPQQQADVNAAKARLTAAQATLREAQATFRRQSELLAQGFTTRTRFDTAKQALDGAVAGLDRSRAELGRAEDALANTELRATADGVVTARSAEVGQVVDVAQKIYTVAQDGPRDAVFDVFETMLADPAANRQVEVSLVGNPAVKTSGIVREIAPTVDMQKGTVRVKVALDHPPAEMGLGAPVSGVFQSRHQNEVVLPWTAFFAAHGQPAVWVVDARTQAVSLRPVATTGYRTGALVVSAGLNDGDLVVIHGGQLLRPGEIVDPRRDGRDTSKEVKP